MNTDKRVLIAILLSIAVWLLYESFLAPPRTVQPPPAPAAQSPANPSPGLAARTVPDVPAAIESVPAAAVRSQADPGQCISVHNSLYRMTLSENNAGISSVRLFNYKDSLPPPALIAWIRKTFKHRDDTRMPRTDNFKEMIDLDPSDPLPVNTSFVYPDGTLASVPGWQADTTVRDLDVQGNPAKLLFSGTDQNNLRFVKRFEFNPDEYRITFDMVVTNTSAAPIAGNPFLEWTARRPAKSSGGFFGGNTMDAPRFSYLIKDNAEKKDLHDIDKEIIIQGDDVAWTAIEEKYFISALIPEEQRPAQVRLSAGAHLVSCKLLYPQVQLAPGQTLTYRFSLYMGPRDVNILQRQGSGLERTIDFGWFDIIAKPLLLSLEYCAKCQTCSDSCPVYEASGNNEIYRPTYRSEIFRRLVNKYVKPGSKLLKKFNSGDIDLNWTTITRLFELSYRSTLCRRCAQACPM